MDVIFTSILGLIITGIIGIITFAWQEYVKRKTVLAKNQKELYEKLLHRIFQLFIEKRAPAQSRMLSEIETSWLFASDRVLDALYEYLELYDKYSDKKTSVLYKIRTEDRVRRKFEKVIGKIFLEMRKDVKGISTRNMKKWSETRVKIYDWGIAPASNEEIV